MPVYLHDIPLHEAQARLQHALHAADRDGVLGVERIPLDQNAVGRVLVEAVWARISSPHYHASAMDGFAIRASATDGATDRAPRLLQVDEQATYVDTGDPLPDWADAVIPIENIEPLSEDGDLAAEPRRPHSIRIRAATTPWKHVRSLGEDIVANQFLLPAGQILRPVDLGAMAACGHSDVAVARKPKIAIVPTGSELVPIGQPPEPGEITEFNSLMLSSQVETWGAESHRLPITPDAFDAIRDVLIACADTFDLILLNAGSSAGSEDYSAAVIETVGELLVHGVAVRPGHPVIMGMLNRPAGGQVPVIGVPGYPVSAVLTAEIFVEPMIAAWLGRHPHTPVRITGTLARKVVSPSGDDDYVRVAVGKVGSKTLIAPLQRGAGVITSMVRADGIMRLPRHVQGKQAGDEVEVYLYRQPEELERTILAIGSHDMTLDLIAEALAPRERRLASANVGSLGGLVALRRSEAHMAGSHLLDPESGSYNTTYIEQYLPELPVRLLTLVTRQQGLLVAPGNPVAIRSLADIGREGVRFVNRQRGAGTRVLLDYHLDQLGIAPEMIRGYNREEFTHLAVAAAVASGRVDCGLGIAAAAQALGLDFVPLFEERYDLVIPEEHYRSPLLAPLLDLLSEASFARKVESLPGYDASLMGQLVA